MAAYVLLGAGVLLQLIAVLGICVMRDTLDRLHCVSLGGWGTMLIGIAILVEQYFSLLGDKALLAGFLTALLGPVLVHTTARSFRIRTRGDWRALDDYPVQEGKR
ncbi:MAG TPA: monovalent cation/H(+) antiporter subunit G [Solirubrobacteraceae bacterium]|nr:monovalent cation/H(+) antiporter subunit G [Solirubrobacteraceae bacterium]